MRPQSVCAIGRSSFSEGDEIGVREKLQALGRSELSRGLGLALLRRQGMRSWIESWSECALLSSPLREDSTGASGHSVPLKLHSEIAIILAGMVLNYRSWEATKGTPVSPRRSMRVR